MMKEKESVFWSLAFQSISHIFEGQKIWRINKIKSEASFRISETLAS